MTRIQKHLLLWLPALLLLWSVAALADADPPSRVARLSYVKGEVSFQPAGVDDWVAASVNRPLTTSDRLWTGSGARAEMSVGTAALRLGPESNFSLLNLDDRSLQAQLTQGAINVRLRRLDERESFEIATPHAAVTLLRSGEYRIDVYPDSIQVIVRSGFAQVDGGERAFTVRAGQLARLYGDDALNYTLTRSTELDDFDGWCRQRDERWESAASARYVAPAVIGYEDLDEYGYWAPAPAYGMVWYPRVVPVGWAPYRFGHWAWIEPWGWTWIDNAAWGFAPFHYGRWAFTPVGWAWVPGPALVRPLYAPALVAFIGGGGGWGLGFSFGAPMWGWFPLGPREVYFPAYRASRTYITNVNITNTTVNNTYVTNAYNRYINNDVRHINYVNRNVSGAVTTVPQEAFIHGREVQHVAVNVPARALESAEVMHVAPVAPVRRSVVGATDKPAAAPPPVAAEHRVVTRTSPPPAPVPFAHRQSALTADPGRPLPIPRPTTQNPSSLVTAPMPFSHAGRTAVPAERATTAPEARRPAQSSFGRNVPANERPMASTEMTRSAQPPAARSAPAPRTSGLEIARPSHATPAAQPGHAAPAAPAAQPGRAASVPRESTHEGRQGR